MVIILDHTPSATSYTCHRLHTSCRRSVFSSWQANSSTVLMLTPAEQAASHDRARDRDDFTRVYVAVQ